MTEKNGLRTVVTVIYSCNDNCISCPAPRKGNRENPSLEKIKSEIDKVLKFSKHIEFNGGEPTLRKDMIKILNYTEKHSNEISLLTNAQKFYYEKYAQKVMQLITELKLQDSIYFTGDLDHDEFLTVLSKSTLYLRTYIKDGIASSVLEALSLNVPVVACDNSIRPESVVIYQNEDVKDIVNKVRYVIDDLENIRKKIKKPYIKDTVSEEISIIEKA